jgi:putative ABC transport system ATP-binding protein
MNEASTAEVAPLIVEGVTKRFRRGGEAVEALRGVSLRVERGEFVAVMGASGSGKSTLLHVVAGLTRPDEGRVLVEGRDLAAMSDGRLTRHRRDRIGLVFQAFNLIPSLTAEENALLPMMAAGRSAEAAGRLDALLDRLGIAARRRHRPDALSGGEQQRVAIARALVSEPAILLADEPTGSLDSANGQKLCGLLRGLCDDDGRTIVVVTHEPAVAAWAGRVVILKDGRNLAELAAGEFRDAHSLAARYQDSVSTAEEVSA